MFYFNVKTNLKNIFHRIVFNAKIALKYYSMNISFLCLWAFLSIWVDWLVRSNYGVSIWQNNLGIKAVIKQKGLWQTLLFIGFHMPILEEISFRLWLSFKKYHILTGFFFLLYIISGLLDTYCESIFRVPFIAVLTSIFWLFIKDISSESMVRFSSKNLNYAKLLSIALFGFMHIANFIPLDVKILFVYPFLIIPQLIAGYYLKKIRLELGFMWSVSIHILNNLLSFILNIAV
jgi:hypothetical protein